ncbi:MAG TPA: alpha/beta fold hydrolase [Ktedonobacterales bacterium]|nr:alpha/beta fold hydrolase [Ktedonobacterales bacterium]
MSATIQLLRSTPQPAADYAAALEKLAVLQAGDGDDIQPVCRTTLLTHGARTPRVYVLLHGLSNCPQQFVEFAPLLFARGANVLIPRMPRHGGTDLSGRELARLTPEELCRCGDAIADVARGLGERVTVMGLSAGGVLAAWIAQVRGDVDRAVLVAPSFGVLPPLPILNGAVNRLALWLFATLPNRMVTRNTKSAGPQHAYRAFATHGVTAMVRQGQAVLAGARRAKPAARSVLAVLNDHDTAVNNTLTHQLIRRWRAHGAEDLATYTFGIEHRLIHDMVDPQQPEQQTALVYPILLDLLTRE